MRLKSFPLLILLPVLAGCIPGPAANSPAPSPQTGSAGPVRVAPAADPQAAFIAAFRLASEQKDVQQMLNLYCWDGVDAPMRETVRENVQDELRQSIEGVELVPVEAGKYGPRDEGGIRWKPNLTVVSLLKVRYAKQPGGGLALSEAKHTLGLQNGQYRLTVPVRDK